MSRPEPQPVSSNPDALDFTDIEPREIPVRIKDSQGIIQNYILYDASGHAEILYRNRQQAHSYVGPDGKRVLRDVNDAIPVLIANCMTTTKPEKGQLVSTGQLIDEKLVRSWPTKVVDQLFDKILDISGMKTDTLEELLKAKAAIEEQIAKVRQGDQLKNSSGGTGKPSTCAENSSSPSVPDNGSVVRDIADLPALSNA
jgi:hypothetical protein